MLGDNGSPNNSADEGPYSPSEEDGRSASSKKSAAGLKKEHQYKRIVNNNQIESSPSPKKKQKTVTAGSLSLRGRNKSSPRTTRSRNNASNSRKQGPLDEASDQSSEEEAMQTRSAASAKPPAFCKCYITNEVAEKLKLPCPKILDLIFSLTMPTEVIVLSDVEEEKKNGGPGKSNDDSNTDSSSDTSCEDSDPLNLNPEVVLRMASDFTRGSLDVPSATKIIECLVNLSGQDRVAWEDVCGLHDVKDTIEIDIVLPWKDKANVFTGLRSASRGILMYGPPGSGKTMIASQLKAKFFNITASSLVTKWAGEAERAVKTLFQVARAVQPSVIFIDEVDALLSIRTEEERHWERRVKTEFLTEMDGCNTKSSDKVIIIGATNLPKSIDPAFLRRFQTRLYVGLPELDDRKKMLQRIMLNTSHSLTQADFNHIANETEGYSGSDLRNLCKWASKNIFRQLSKEATGKRVLPKTIRPVVLEDFLEGLLTVKSTVPQKVLDELKAFHI
ncbi:hypothetical protein FOCC_FOCC015567 [Frankliniella occidentalis]|nr:hypothetical protein FOCC_FOCC015567 [Frankliniella occidentalis]